MNESKMISDGKTGHKTGINNKNAIMKSSKGKMQGEVLIKPSHPYLRDRYVYLYVCIYIYTYICIYIYIYL
jgi:hypothetical protein